MKLKSVLVLALLLINASLVMGQGCNIVASYHTPIVRNNESNFTLSGLRISNASGHGITLNNCTNVIIKDCIIANTYLNGVNLMGCTNVTIQNCSFEKNQMGVYAQGGSGGIKVISNKFSNSIGTTALIGHMVQFNKVNGAGSEVSYNFCEMSPSYFKVNSNYTDDLISIYQCNGTAANPILVKGNLLRGGRQSGASTGIIAGDNGGSYIIVRDNILVDPGQAGIAVPGGNNITIINNQIYGREQDSTNVGLYVADLYPVACRNIGVYDNRVNFIKGNCKKWPTACHTSAGYWIPSTKEKWHCDTVFRSNNDWNAPINESILPPRLLCPDLVVHYKFDNNLSEANGIVPMYATQTGGLSYACGNRSSASFDGVNDVVTLPMSDQLKPSSHQFMFTSWIFPTDFNRIMSVAHSQDGDGYNDGWRLILINGGLYGTVVSDASNNVNIIRGNVSASGLTLNNWNFVGLSYDGATVKLYINGLLVSSAPLSGGIRYNAIPHTNNMRVGFSDGQNYFFKGRIDDVKFYRGGFTDTEMLAEYNQNKVFFNANAVRPNVSIASSPSLDVCQGGSTLTASPGGADTYSWSSSDGIVGQSQSLVVSYVDTYTVTVTILGCTNSSSISTFCSTGHQFERKSVQETGNSNEQAESQGVSSVVAYPNPARNKTTITLSAKAEIETPISICNTMGEVVYTTKIEKGESEKTVDLGCVTEGLYLVRVFTETQTKTTRLIIKEVR